ncbi:MAG: hypothetical protein OHK0013_33480 [Sandaracinaceae bacterium]
MADRRARLIEALSDRAHRVVREAALLQVAEQRSRAGHGLVELLGVRLSGVAWARATSVVVTTATIVDAAAVSGSRVSVRGTARDPSDMHPSVGPPPARRAYARRRVTKAIRASV